jgi:hypothetical protein
VEAHPGVMETYPGAMEANPGGAMEPLRADSGAMGTKVSIHGYQWTSIVPG